MIKVNCLNENKATPKKYPENLFTAVSIGFFFLLVGAIFLTTPNLFDKIMDFFNDLSLVIVPNTNIKFPGPVSPALHLALYQAAEHFCIAMAFFQVFMLALRFVIPSSWGKRSETVGNLVYWAGASFLLSSFPLENLQQWFAFWSTIIMLIGISLITRAAVTALSRS